MKKVLFYLITALIITNPIYTQVVRDTILVSNTEEFIQSFQSNKVVIINSDHISIRNELVISDIHNLEIRNNSSKKTKITTDKPGNTVITFKDCSNISLHNLSVGHWPDVGYCTGNVLDIFNSDTMYIYDSDLFGSGVIGLYLRSSSVWCYNSVIRDCSENILDIGHQRSSLIFENCNFYLNQKNEIHYPGPRFENCNFFGNDSTSIKNKYSGFYPKEPLVIKAKIDTPHAVWSKPLNDYGEFESVCPNTFSIATSSNLKPYKNITYQGQNISEIQFTTGETSAWVEGVRGDGIGEKISFKVNSIIADYESWGISGEFIIINGYAKNLKTWTNNNRVKQFKISRNNHVVAYLDLIDSPNAQSFRLGDIVDNNHFALGEILEFEITKVFKGDKYNDTAITYLSACCSP